MPAQGSSSSCSNMFGLKFQKIFKAPVAEPRLRSSLPAAPKGMEWLQSEETKEWRLVKAAEPELLQEVAASADPPEVVATVSPDLPTNKRCSSEQHHSSDPVLPTTQQQQLPPRQCEVDRLPPRSCVFDKEEDWELLSDRLSSSSNQTPGVIVHRGSIRSIASVEEQEGCSHSSIPFKIQRTASSSTIDSQDGALGPLGKGVLGVDYVEHVVLPTDTLQGICLAYKISSSTKLRQANHFSGNSLLLAPKKLVIPISKSALRSGFIRVQDTDAKEYKLHAFLAEFPDTSMTEAKAYLELADWTLKDAVRSAREDGEWERDLDNCSLRSGEIRITPTLNKDSVAIGFATQGAGIQPRAAAAGAKHKKSSNNVSTPSLRSSSSGRSSTKVTAHKDIPAIATKSVKAQDVYSAAPQHNSIGVELQSVVVKKDEATNMSGMRS